MRGVTLFLLYTSTCIWKASVGGQETESPSCDDGDSVSLASLLRARFADQPSALTELGEKLRQGRLVVIHNALPQELADRLHDDLDSIPAQDWPLHEHCFAHGFCFAHHNIYDWNRFTDTMNRTLALFDHPDTQDWMTQLSGRNCRGTNWNGHASFAPNPTGTASWYMPGDFSLPHTDHVGHRTVAYVWHLAKNWRPEWGGALFWDASDDVVSYSYHHASYNALVLFQVSPRSTHFVTTVSRHAQSKRLAFNGWWTTDWRVSSQMEEVADRIEDRLKSTHRDRLADEEYYSILSFVEQKDNNLTDSQRGRLRTLLDQIHLVDYPPTSAGIYR